ncbi:MAG: endonuclease III [Candidatus Nanoarchaeia archaeon]|nr:endonuclease III [Candidatus Nanoarchaeia archaeon]
MNNISQIIEIVKESQKDIRKTTLNREGKDTKNFTPFQTLIACIISLRVKDEITERIVKDLFKIANTPEKILKLSNKELEKIIYSSGYYKNKTKTIKKLAEIVKNNNNKVPDNEEELMKLPGVGKKTCNIVLSFAYDKNVIAVDTNVHRICNRLGWVKTKTLEKTEEELKKILPEKYWREINGIFILFGKSICVPISPKCLICPVNKYCSKTGVIRSR